MQPATYRALIAAVLLAALTAAATADTYTVTLDPTARDTPATGRIVLYFITKSDGMWDRAWPLQGPFYFDPMPIASVAVKDLQPGASATLDGSVFAFPDSLDKLDGTIRVQAILDADETERAATDGPGNVASDVVKVSVSAKNTDEKISITLTKRVRAHALPPERDNLKWFQFRSEMLSAFYGRDVYHRAGVALPLGYLDPAKSQKHWPAIYVIPGFGGRYNSTRDGGSDYADLLKDGFAKFIPQAVHIVVDPESPLGHHGFADSECNGPRGAAFVKEFIPYLESKLRLLPEPKARILTGHSSGGWSALWLQLHWPDVFGACWSSSPDPVDFTAFQMSNLYEDANLYIDADLERPSYREHKGNEIFDVRMTVRQEGLMEHAIDPTGRSGEQWDAWAAMFSPRDESTGQPKPMFDPITGAIHRDVAEQWSKYDINKLVSADWPRFGPILTGRVRLAVGSFDSFYLHRAVEKLKATIDAQAGAAPATAAGYVLIKPRATHNNIMRKVLQRWNDEMIAYLKENNLSD